MISRYSHYQYLIINSTQRVVQLLLDSTLPLPVALPHYVQVPLVSPTRPPPILQLPIVLLMGLIPTVPHQQHPMVGLPSAGVYQLIGLKNAFLIVFHFGGVNRNRYGLSSHCCLHADFFLRRDLHASQYLRFLHIQVIYASIGETFVGIFLLRRHPHLVEIAKRSRNIPRNTALISQVNCAINHLLWRELNQFAG